LGGKDGDKIPGKIIESIGQEDMTMK